jgi:hypothetical protein
MHAWGLVSFDQLLYRAREEGEERQQHQGILQEKLLALNEVHIALEGQFQEIKEERDMALADLQVLVDQCRTLVEEQTQLFEQAPTESHQVFLLDR